MFRNAIRPRFKIKCSLGKTEAMDKLMAKKDDGEIRMKKIIHRVKLTFPLTRQEYWSPVLTVSFEEDEDGSGTILNCLVGPKEKVWLLFLLVYASAAMLLLFGGIHGLSQMSLGIESVTIYSIPISILMILSTFLAAKIGQSKGQEQMQDLIMFVFDTLEIPKEDRKNHLIN